MAQPPRFVRGARRGPYARHRCVDPPARWRPRPSHLTNGRRSVTTRRWNVRTRVAATGSTARKLPDSIDRPPLTDPISPELWNRTPALLTFYIDRPKTLPRKSRPWARDGERDCHGRFVEQGGGSDLIPVWSRHSDRGRTGHNRLICGTLMPALSPFSTRLMTRWGLRRI